MLRARGPLLESLTLFQEPELFLSLFVRDLAAAVSYDHNLGAVGISHLPRPRYSVCTCTWALGQRPRGGDYLVEQEQREGDEEHGRFCDYRQPPAL